MTNNNLQIQQVRLTIKTMTKNTYNDIYYITNQP
jgi:hypothetical protein